MRPPDGAADSTAAPESRHMQTRRVGRLWRRGHGSTQTFGIGPRRLSKVLTPTVRRDAGGAARGYVSACFSVVAPSSPRRSDLALTLNALPPARLLSPVAARGQDRVPRDRSFVANDLQTELLRRGHTIRITSELEVRVDMNLVLQASHHALVDDHSGCLAKSPYAIRVHERRYRVLTTSLFKVAPLIECMPVFFQDAGDFAEVRFESLPAVLWKPLVELQ